MASITTENLRTEFVTTVMSKSAITNCKPAFASPSRSRILVDLSTSWRHRSSPPVGIIRCEHEIARHFLSESPENVIFGYFSDETQGYSQIPQDAVIEMITSSASAGSSSTSNRDAPNEQHLVHDSSSGKSYTKTFVAGLLFANYMVGRLFGFNNWRLKGATRAKQYVADHHDEIDFETLGRLAKLWASGPTVDLRAPLRGLRMTLVHSAPPPGSLPVQMDTIGAILLPGVFWEGSKAKWLWKVKSQRNIHISLLLFDLIPIVVRQFSESGAAQNFAACLHYLLWACDHFFCISDSTAYDLRQYVDACGYPPILDSKAQVCRLGPARFVHETTPDLVEYSRILGSEEINPGEFVLFVSTIESRKNHDFAYHLWRRLALKHGAKLFPLVFAGKQGWDTESLMRKISQDPAIAGRHIVHFDNVNDDQLRWLYANCAFTIFPSHYEGFGMTVAESLAFGKPCIASKGSSVEEAGQGLADHIDTLDGIRWIETIENYMFDKNALAIKSDRIRNEYKPYTWDEFTTPIVRHMLQTADFKPSSESNIR
ncbi:glycosyltransferase [Mesorhizobium sp. CO1-1-9]|uniref:glycosyltransferase n=1 Tax=Mesorhizobium sp. CO1-1-9 TaxID=2876630 RepID=UPI001CCD1392|nr:glycosyltransferase [Mesorhizobium sp. CO1-1-9]MBZ9694842.1 glycosyltransferase [Mesorhizobium sp. CO1-1-9]